MTTSEGTTPADADDGAVPAETGATANRVAGARPLPARNEPINDLMAFLDFVGRHPVGSTVSGQVEQFSSHGAYVDADGVRCYVPLRLMGHPPPRSARNVLKVGETREFVVVSFNPVRRGVDVALPEGVPEDLAAPVAAPPTVAPDAPADLTVPEERAVEPAAKRTRARKARATPVAPAAADVPAAAPGPGEASAEAVEPAELVPPVAHAEQPAPDLEPPEPIPLDVEPAVADEGRGLAVEPSEEVEMAPRVPLDVAAAAVTP